MLDHADWCVVHQLDDQRRADCREPLLRPVLGKFRGDNNLATTAPCAPLPSHCCNRRSHTVHLHHNLDNPAPAATLMFLPRNEDSVSLQLARAMAVCCAEPVAVPGTAT